MQLARSRYYKSRKMSSYRRIMCNHNNALWWYIRKDNHSFTITYGTVIKSASVWFYDVLCTTIKTY